MKKLFSILLMMALLTGGASSARAQAAASIDQDIVAGEDIWLSSSVFLGDKLYLTGQGNVFSYAPGEDAIQKEVHGASPDWLARAEASQPFGKLAKPDELAFLISYMLSPQSGVMTGSLVDYDQNVAGII